MIETQISITVNRKSDIALLEQKIIENQFQFPVYIREYAFNSCANVVINIAVETLSGA